MSFSARFAIVTVVEGRPAWDTSGHMPSENAPSRSSQEFAMETSFSPPGPNESVEQVTRNLVLANHILALKEVVDAFGHVSQRCPWNPGHFMIARSVAPASVTAVDIVELDLDGNTVSPDAPPSYLERFIHAEIYRARPDVQAVVHSHSPAVIPFAVVPGVSLRSIFHLTGFLGAKPPVFEVRDTAGDGTDLLVRNAKSGAALAASLGDASVVLMRDTVRRLSARRSRKRSSTRCTPR